MGDVLQLQSAFVHVLVYTCSKQTQLSKQIYVRALECSSLVMQLKSVPTVVRLHIQLRYCLLLKHGSPYICMDKLLASVFRPSGAQSTDVCAPG